ncbi:MAG: endonuclease MutS2 [Leptolyngbyaceae cyanobacterium]
MIQAETFNLLEWQRLCQHLATFAATKLGAMAATHLRIATTRAETLEWLAQTREMYELETRLSAGLSFEGIQDIGDSLERSERGAVLSGNELLEIATTLAGMRSLRRLIDDQPDLLTLNQLIAELRTYPELEQAIHQAIDDRGQVMDRASVRLEQIRGQQRSLRDRVYDMLQSILQRKANAIQEHLITQRSDRFVLPVKAQQKDAIPGIVHDSSTSGATLYIEPQPTVGLNNQLRQLKRQEEVEEEAIRRALTEQVEAVRPDLERLLAIATILDLATARARYSLWLGANPPQFIESGKAAIVLRQLRHPLLVWQHQHEQGPDVVPIDVIVQPQTRVVAITGPNTGGKTVTLKTLGLAVLMAKVGLFVPAREPVELPWFDQVLADIGDEQSLQQSLSTFSGHIRRIVRILQALGQRTGDREQPPPLSESQPSLPQPGPQSETAEAQVTADQARLTTNLVLLDEVGAGTDPSEGSALAISLLQYLAGHAALTIATTHFGELKALKYQDQRFENASVEFDDVSLSPTYRLLWGIPGRSNALTIAQRLGLDSEIVETARVYVGGASQDVNQIIAGLEEQRRRQESKSEAASQLLEQAELLHQQVSQKAAALQARERDLQLAQEQAIQATIAAAKQEIAAVIRKLQQGPITAQAAQQATAELSQITAQRLPSRQPKFQPQRGFQPQVGDRIRIPRLGQTAEVLSPPNQDEELTVRFGLMKMTISLSDIESLDGEKPLRPEKPEFKASNASRHQKSEDQSAAPDTQETQGTATPVIQTAQNTLDIRGSRVADAEPLIEAAIQRAQKAGVLWIIHGHGTGKLRQGVQDFLQRHPQVDRFELAPRQAGGAGVTIAYLR